MTNDILVKQYRDLYNDLQDRKRSIQREVTERYKKVIEQEVRDEILAEETRFAEGLVKLRNDGVLRRDIATIIKTSDNDKMRYFMDLGGWKRPSSKMQTGADVKRSKFESKKQELLDRMGLTEFVDDRFETAYRAENGAILKVQESGHLLPIPDEEQPETKTEGWVDWFQSVKSERRELGKLLREEKNGE